MRWGWNNGLSVYIFLQLKLTFRVEKTSLALVDIFRSLILDLPEEWPFSHRFFKNFVQFCIILTLIIIFGMTILSIQDMCLLRVPKLWLMVNSAYIFRLHLRKVLIYHLIIHLWRRRKSLIKFINFKSRSIRTLGTFVIIVCVILVRWLRIHSIVV